MALSIRPVPPAIPLPPSPSPPRRRAKPASKRKPAPRDPANAPAARIEPSDAPPHDQQARPDDAGAARRFDGGKARWDLVPPDALAELVDVYTFGATKYGDRNWERGMAWSRCFGSMMRHAWAWFRGERVDPESGLHHLAHVAWNALALVAYERRGSGTDDRPANL